jgi:hypothetical protein
MLMYYSGRNCVVLIYGLDFMDWSCIRFIGLWRLLFIIWKGSISNLQKKQKNSVINLLRHYNREILVIFNKFSS